MNLPIILLTAKVEESAKIEGLSIGADDYVSKPFSPRELVARVKAQLRRSGLQEEAPENEVLRFGDLTIIPLERRVTVSGATIQLTPKEYDLLLTMAKHPGRVYNRELLYEMVWGDAYGDLRTVDVHVTRLRNKVETGAAQFIHTVWSIGYRFEAAVPK